MKNLILTLLFYLVVTATLHAQKVDWHLHYGASYIDQLDDHKIAQNGDVYILGRFSGEIDFDPGPNEVKINHVVTASNNLFAMYLAKFNAQGDFQWVKYIGDEDGVMFARRLVLDEARGALYISGYFTRTIDFDPGPGTHNLTSSRNFFPGNSFLAKYNMDGELIWAENIAKGLESKSGISMDLAKNGDIYIHQSVAGRTDIDPDPDETFWVEDLSSSGTASHQYIARYTSANCDLVWAKVFKSEGNSNFSKILKTDPDGNIYMVGHFQGRSTTGSIDLDPDLGKAVVRPLFDDQDAFMAKYSPDGDYIWHTIIQTNAYVAPEDIAFNSNGTVYLVGAYAGQADFDGSDSNATLSAGGVADAFLAKYSPIDGSYIEVWNIARGYSRDDNDRATAHFIRLDKNDNIYITGRFTGKRDFGPNDSLEILGYSKDGGGNVGSEKTTDIWLIYYDKDLHYQWLTTIGSNGKGHDLPSGNLSLHNNRLMLSGRFVDTVDIGVGSEDVILKGNGREEGFVVNYDLTGTVGVYDPELALEKNQLDLYPVPFSNQLNIALLNNSESISSILLNDVKGKTVINQKNDKGSKLTIDTSSLLPGIYLLKVHTSEDKTITRKLIKH